jgi:hypothetical protein
MHLIQNNSPGAGNGILEINKNYQRFGLFRALIVLSTSRQNQCTNQASMDFTAKLNYGPCLGA